MNNNELDYDRQIMSDPTLDDMEKLYLEFNLHKDEIKKASPSIYYCILAILDKSKQGYRFTKALVPKQDKFYAEIIEVLNRNTCKLRKDDGTELVADLNSAMRLSSPMQVGSVAAVQQIMTDRYIIVGVTCHSRRFNEEDQ